MGAPWWEDSGPGRGERRTRLLLEAREEQSPSLAEDPADVHDVLHAWDLPTEMANSRPGTDQEAYKHTLLSLSLQ